MRRRPVLPPGQPAASVSNRGQDPERIAGAANLAAMTLGIGVGLIGKLLVYGKVGELGNADLHNPGDLLASLEETIWPLQPMAKEARAGAEAEVAP